MDGMAALKPTIENPVAMIYVEREVRRGIGCREVAE